MGALLATSPVSARTRSSYPPSLHVSSQLARTPRISRVRLPPPTYTFWARQQLLTQGKTEAIGVAQTICGSSLPSGAVSSLTSAPTPSGNATTGSGSYGNSTKTGGSGSTSTGSGSSASSTGASSNSAAGLLPGGFAVAAIFAGLLTL